MGKGSWTFDGTSYQFELFVTAVASDPADEVQLMESWQRAFAHASEILFNATHGQIRIDKIHFLNQGPTASDEDILLYETTTGDNVTSGKCFACASPVMSGQVLLNTEAKQGPNTIIHELGHYLFCLEEEYYEAKIGGKKVAFRLCTNDAELHACFMEFGNDKGIQLDGLGVPATVQPEPMVNQFCYGDYRDGSGIHLNCVQFGLGISWNSQHAKNKKSCWETMKDGFDQLTLPADITTTPPAFEAPTWIERTAKDKFGIVVLGTNQFADFGIESAVKSGIGAWASFAANGGHQFALLTDLSFEQPVWEMASLSAEGLQDLLCAWTNSIFPNPRPHLRQVMDFSKSISLLDQWPRFNI